MHICLCIIYIYIFRYIYIHGERERERESARERERERERVHTTATGRGPTAEGAVPGFPASAALSCSGGIELIMRRACPTPRLAQICF